MLFRRPWFQPRPPATRIQSLAGTSYTLPVTAASIPVTGDAGIGFEFASTWTEGSIPVTGSAVTLSQGTTFAVSPASITISGESVGFGAAAVLPVTPAAITVSGLAVTAAVSLNFSERSIPVTGSNVGGTLAQGGMLVTAAEIFVLGEAVSLSRTNLPPPDNTIRTPRSRTLYVQNVRRFVN